MRVLIIGGAGYIGSHVVKEFLRNGAEVGVFDNLSAGLRENLFREAEFFHGDILRPEQLRSVMQRGWDAVVHLAAKKAAGESMINPGKYAVNNITGSINILNLMVETGITSIIFSSSAAVYGEPQYLPIDERHPTEPQNFYGYTKLNIEELLEWYDKLKGVRYTALRYFNAAGYDPEGEILGLEVNPANLIPIIMEAALGWREKLQIFGEDYDTPDGTCIRDYIHVTDLARAHVMAAEYIQGKEKSLLVNLGTGSGKSVKEVLQAARRTSGKAIPAEVVPRRPGDPAQLWASSDKALELLGWNAKYSDIEILLKTAWNVYNKASQ